MQGLYMALWKGCGGVTASCEEQYVQMSARLRPSRVLLIMAFLAALGLKRCS